MPIDNDLSKLSNIRIKVRRLVRSPSSAQISEDDINEYINTFILYDFPEHLRSFYLRSTITFYTDPYVDTYRSDSVDATSPLYNFKNKYLTTHGPIYIAGYPAFFSQSREQFFNTYPMLNSIASTGNTGDGATTLFTGTLSAIPVLAGSVIFTSIDANNNGVILKDDGDGNIVLPGGGVTAPVSTINYVTGAYAINFPIAPALAADIKSQTVPYVAARPQSVCYFENAFILRPVPDQVYAVNIEVNKRPTELLADADEPGLSEWWQYIAYGAAKKILEDRLDSESIQEIMPEFKNQETLLLRRTIVQQSNERVATIYTDNSNCTF